MKLLLPGGGGAVALLPGDGGSGMVQKRFCRLTKLFDIQFKNTSNLILLSFKVQSERFFTNFSKQVLLFEICGFKNCKIESEIVNI